MSGRKREGEGTRVNFLKILELHHGWILALPLLPNDCARQILFQALRLPRFRFVRKVEKDEPTRTCSYLFLLQSLRMVQSVFGGNLQNELPQGVSLYLCGPKSESPPATVVAQTDTDTGYLG